MATPTDLQNASSAIQWTNGQGLVTGAAVSGMFAIVIAILAGMGTWGSSGYTPNIASGSITAAQLAAGAAAANLGSASGSVSGAYPGPLALTPTGVTAGAYGAAAQSLNAIVGADGRLTALSAQAIAIPGSQVSGPLFDGVATFATLPSSPTRGERIFCADCLKPGQAAGSGSGMPLFYDGSGWFSSAGTAAAH